MTKEKIMITGKIITDGVRKCAFIVLLILFASCSGNKQPQRDSEGRILKNGQFYDNQESETGQVWICTGKSSHAYHSTEECYGIQSCRARKKKMSKDEAISMGRTPCHYCHKETEVTCSATGYVYIDYAWVLHTKNNCRAVYKDHGAQAVRPVKVEDVDLERLDRVCSQCTTPNQIEELREYIVENQ